QDIRDRLDPPVGVPRKAREVILRPVIAEIVEEKERVELGCVAETERASQVYTRSFDGRLGLAEALDRPDGHLNLLCLGVQLEVGVTFCRGMRAKNGQIWSAATCRLVAAFVLTPGPQRRQIDKSPSKRALQLTKAAPEATPP